MPHAEQCGQPERRFGRFLKSKVSGRRLVTLVVIRLNMISDNPQLKSFYSLTELPENSPSSFIPQSLLSTALLRHIMFAIARAMLAFHFLLFATSVIAQDDVVTVHGPGLVCTGN